MPLGRIRPLRRPERRNPRKCGYRRPSPNPAVRGDSASVTGHSGAPKQLVKSIAPQAPLQGTFVNVPWNFWRAASWRLEDEFRRDCGGARIAREDQIRPVETGIRRIQEVANLRPGISFAQHVAQAIADILRVIQEIHEAAG